jgi:hypothetical protein
MDLLNGNQKLYSIDLSSATDRFPLPLQTYFLRMVGAGSWADALEEVCSEPYYTEITDKPSYWHFGAGQPMGLYGSFPLFTLTYICFCLGIYQTRQEQLHGRTPSIDEMDWCLRDVGDDLIVRGFYFGRALATQFEKLGVEMSPTKSLNSKMFAEFAGFVVSTSSHGTFAYRPLVHHPKKSFRNPLSILDNLGCRVMKLDRGRSTYWHRQYERFSNSLRYRNPDLSPTFQTSEIETSSDGWIDLARLEQLVMQASHEAGLNKDYWTGESYSLTSLADLCLLLLDEQADGDEPISFERSAQHNRVKDCAGRTPINRDPLPEVERPDTFWETRKSLKADPFQSGSYDSLLFEQAVEQKPVGSGQQAGSSQLLQTPGEASSTEGPAVGSPVGDRSPSPLDETRHESDSYTGSILDKVLAEAKAKGWTGED